MASVEIGLIRAMKIMSMHEAKSSFGMRMETARADPGEVGKHGRGVMVVKNADIATNGFNIAVSFDVEWRGASEALDIKMLNAEIARIVARQAELRAIGAIAADLEGNEA